MPHITHRHNRRAFVLASLAVSLAAHPAFGMAQVASPVSEMTEDGLRELEAARLRSLVDFDMDTAMAFHAADFQLINPSGWALTREEYLGSLQDGFIDYEVFEPAGDIFVRLVPSAGVLRYLSNLEIVVAGELVPIRNYWHTDYYELRDGRWQAVLSHATEVLS